MKNPEKRTEEYLERTQADAEKGSNIPPEEFILVAKGLTDRLTEKQWQAEGTMEFNLPAEKGKDGVTCVIEYDSSRDENFSAYLSKFPDSYGGKFWKNSFRKINGLVLQKGKEKLDLKEICGECFIYANPSHNEGYVPELKLKLGRGVFWSSIENHKPTLCIEDDLCSINGLFTLMHELGHFSQNNNLSEEAKILGQTARQKRHDQIELSPREKEQIIREERAASAFAFKKLRKFLDKDTLEKVKLGMQRDIKSHFNFPEAEQ